MPLLHPMYYCTVNSIIEQLNGSENTVNVSTTAQQNTLIANESANRIAEYIKFIREVSALMSNTKALARVFVPYERTKTIRRNETGYRLRRAYADYRANNDYALQLDDDILSVSSLTWIGTVVSSDDYYLDNDDNPPSCEIIIQNDNLATTMEFSDSIQVAGIWGYHRYPSQMFIDSGDTVQDNPLSASATLLTVNDASVFEYYQYLRIEDEYLLVTNIDTDNNELTVQRGVNGTTAASHAQTTTIETYQQTPEVANEARRLVIRQWMLKYGIGSDRAFVVSPDAIKDLTTIEVQMVVTPPTFIRSIG